MVEEKKFLELVANWEYQVRYEKSARTILLHPGMTEIILLGHDAVPLLLKTLKDNWYLAYALYKITGFWPVRDEFAGNEERIIDSWLKWGLKNGYKA